MPANPRYNPPEGYKPPKEAGQKKDIGVGNRAAPQREGESDADFKKRQAQWMKSYMARGGVKLKDMNQGQLNKYVASGGAHRAEAVGANLGRFVGKGDNSSSSSSNTPTQGPSSPPQDLPPGANHQTNNNNPGRQDNPGRGGQGMTANGGSAQSTGGFGGPIGAMGSAAGLSRMPGQGRRANRRAAQIARRRSMVGGK